MMSNRKYTRSYINTYGLADDIRRSQAKDIDEFAKYQARDIDPDKIEALVSEAIAKYPEFEIRHALICDLVTITRDPDPRNVKPSFIAHYEHSVWLTMDSKITGTLFNTALGWHIAYAGIEPIIKGINSLIAQYNSENKG